MRDLNKTRCRIRENARYLDGKRDLTAPGKRNFKIWARNAETATLLALELKNLKSTASIQTNMSSKQYIKRCKQQKRTLKNCKVNKFSKTTIAIRFNLLQVYSSGPPFLVNVIFTFVYCYVWVIVMFHSIWRQLPSLKFF